MSTDLTKLAALSVAARAEYSDGYEKAYKNIPDLCDGIDALRAKLAECEKERDSANAACSRVVKDHDYIENIADRQIREFIGWLGEEKARVATLREALEVIAVGSWCDRSIEIALTALEATKEPG